MTKTFICFMCGKEESIHDFNILIIDGKRVLICDRCKKRREEWGLNKTPQPPPPKPERMDGKR